MTEVWPNLFVGNSFDAIHAESEIRQAGITAIVNLAKDLHAPWFDGILSIKVGLMDGPGNDEVLYALAEQVVNRLLDERYRVLLHCHEGRSRSASIAARVIAQREGVPLGYAVEVITAKRPIVAIHGAHL